MLDFHLLSILLDGMSIGPRRSPSLGQQSSKPAVGATFKPETPLMQLVKQQMSAKIKLLYILSIAVDHIDCVY